jgi:hypothetical protein
MAKRKQLLGLTGCEAVAWILSEMVNLHQKLCRRYSMKANVKNDT